MAMSRRLLTILLAVVLACGLLGLLAGWLLAPGVAPRLEVGRESPSNEAVPIGLVEEDETPSP